MEYCRARRISAALTCDAPSAHALKSAHTINLIRMSSSLAPRAFFLIRGGPALCGSLDLRNAAVPVEDLLAVPVQHAFVLVHVVVDLLEVFDPVRLPADVGVYRQGAEFGALCALGVEPVELVDRALEQIVAL